MELYLSFPYFVSWRAQGQLYFTFQTRYNALMCCCLYTACSEVAGGTHFFQELLADAKPNGREVTCI